MKNRFLELVKSKVGCGYAWATQGETLTEQLLRSFVQQWGEGNYYFSGYSAEKWFGKECFDCSGLIVWALQQLGLLTTDLTADGLYRICEPISRAALEPGDLVFYQNSNGYKSHVGVYMGNGKVIHARGTAYGVVETEMFSSFTAFGRLKVFPPKQEKPHWAEEPYTYLSQRIVIHEKRFNEPVTRGEVFALLAQVVSLLDK